MKPLASDGLLAQYLFSGCGGVVRHIGVEGQLLLMPNVLLDIQLHSLYELFLLPLLLSLVLNCSSWVCLLHSLTIVVNICSLLRLLEMECDHLSQGLLGSATHVEGLAEARHDLFNLRRLPVQIHVVQGYLKRD